MDRTKPRYRLFDLTDEADGRPMVWHTVSADNTPGDEVPEEIAYDLFDHLELQPWRYLFWQAFAKNKKATLYEPLPF